MTAQTRSARVLSEELLVKVPAITAFFWVIKLCTTAMGEATSDYLVARLGSVQAVLLGFAVFVVALVLQLWVRKYIAWVYWLTAAMVSVFGTMAADVVHIRLKVPYSSSTTFYAFVLIVIFVLWYRVEGTLSIHSITNRRRELFYWATVTATFALGTAAGDMTAVTLHLGYLSSGFLFAGAFAVPAVLYGLLKLNAVLTFWFAYIMTRPFGASFADWVAKPRKSGGLAHGDGIVAGILAVVIVALVAYLTASKADLPET